MRYQPGKPMSEYNDEIESIFNRLESMDTVVQFPHRFWLQFCWLVSATGKESIWFCGFSLTDFQG